MDHWKNVSGWICADVEHNNEDPITYQSRGFGGDPGDEDDLAPKVEESKGQRDV